MLYNLLAPLADGHAIFNLFRYLTFRTGSAIITALIVSFLFGPIIIRWLRVRQRSGQPIRTDGPKSHLTAKAGTPTMGGVLILLAVSVATLLWADITNQFVWVVLFVTLGFGLVGFVDDYLKVTRQHHAGLPGIVKLLIEIAIAGTAAVASSGSGAGSGGRL